MTLELCDICLRYSKKTVLDNLSLSFEGGQIHALLGENGAGKSTTANIICGEIKPDSGQIFVDKESINFGSPKDAIEHGICYVHQTPMLADSISVKENLLLGIKKEYRKNILPVAQNWIPEIPLKTCVKNLSSGMRVFTALCSALIKCPRLLILDEPTALLDENQKAFLFDRLRHLAKEGMNIILITHNMDEAENYCDTIDFLEDGKLAQKKPLPLIKDILSRESTDIPENRVPLHNLDLKLYKGKITLVQGLAEDGLDSLEKTVIERKGLPMKAAIIPTDRKYTASNPNLSVLQMLTAALDIPQNQKETVAAEMIQNAGVNITLHEKCRNLSGGMLQKLLFERELYNNPQLLILCNPLQGLDTVTCTATCERIKKAAHGGAAILILSYGAFPSKLSDIFYRLNNRKLELISECRNEVS